jgi:hypothetical protein
MIVSDLRAPVPVVGVLLAKKGLLGPADALSEVVGHPERVGLPLRVGLEVVGPVLGLAERRLTERAQPLTD